jgi:hypothetical protein
MYTHKVNIPYHNMYTSFWDTLYTIGRKIVAKLQNQWNLTTTLTRLQSVVIRHRTAVAFLFHYQRETVCECADWIELAQDRVQQNTMDIVMNLDVL